MSFSTLYKAITPHFQDDVTGHDMHHIDRVVRMARHLQSLEGGNLELIEIAALLHDISDHKFNGGKLNAGGEAAYALLLNYDYDSDFALKVKEIVDQVSFKGAKTKTSTDLCIEAQIVQDADRLDALGAIGIARTFAFGGHRGQAIYKPEMDAQLHHDFESYAKAETTSINHFYEKLLLLKSLLNTASARTIAEERHRFMEEFLDRFYSEWNQKLHV